MIVKLRVISSRSEIPHLSPRERMVHVAFRPSNVDFLNLMQRCPRLRLVQIPPSYKRSMSIAIKVFLEMQGVELLEGDVWGHRKDLDEYYTVDEDTVSIIKDMAREGADLSTIAESIQKKARVGQDLISFIARATPA